MLETYRTRETDTASVQDPQAVAMFSLPEVEVSPFYDFMSFAPDITTHKYKIGSRSRTPLTVTVDGAVATNGTTVTVDQPTRVSDNYILFDQATKQTVTLGSNTTGGTFNIRSVVPQDGSSRAIIADNAELVVLAVATDYNDGFASQTFEQTSEQYNYVQDISVLIERYRADREEARDWNVDDTMLMTETMTRHLRQINLNMIYGTPQENAEGNNAANGQTAGFDYLVRKVGASYSKAGASDELSDLKAAFVDLRKEGVGAGEGIAMWGSVDAYEYFNAKAINGFTRFESNGSSFAEGNILTGLQVAGFGFVPFLVDANFRDNHVRIGSQQSVQKAYFNGQGDRGTQSVLRVVDEPGLSTSKKEVRSIQAKLGTVIDAEKCRLYETAIS